MLIFPGTGKAGGGGGGRGCTFVIKKTDQSKCVKRGGERGGGGGGVCGLHLLTKKYSNCKSSINSINSIYSSQLVSASKSLPAYSMTSIKSLNLVKNL